MCITYTFERTFSPADKAADDYHYIPFEVPEGVSRLEVRYDFTRTGHAAHRAGFENILDIGIFDPRGRAFNTPGFRGWSGSARSQFSITPGDATPGYLPGPISPGTWHLILGLYQIAPEGCTCQVTVTLHRESTSPSPSSWPPPFPPRIVRSGPGWYRGDLHTHTHHSDAGASVATLVEEAHFRGLDFLAIMDHNTVSQWRDLAAHADAGVLLIPGMEVTTYYGHANAWGIHRWVDFRCRTSEDMQRVLETVHEQGGLFSANHPCSPVGEAWEYGFLEGMDAVEVWNGPWLRSDYDALLWWERLLDEGHRVTAVGGSDYHPAAVVDPYTPRHAGTPTTWIYAHDLSLPALLEGIRAGRVFISATEVGPRVDLRAHTADGRDVMVGDVLHVSAGSMVTFICQVEAMAGHALEFIHNGSVIARYPLSTGSARVTQVVVIEEEGYVRVQVVETPLSAVYPQVTALTNPIWVTVA